MARYDAAVLRALGRDPRFRSAQEVHALVAGPRSRSSRPPSLSTVYRTLRRLADDGILDTVRSSEGERLYRLCGSDARHHHLVCRVCGEVEEVPEPGELAPLVERVVRASGFGSVDYSFELFGVCPSCVS
ncbi:transcriptional repressor [Nocardiopsis sp. EMB25]|uniref:Fur family transcriptional regulator n=1 Tax=Nocardiopsis TaxID=2013 RepID=UPI0003482595|nr:MULTISPECIES: transcriptional repressor [Nocardiopsis]MCY9783343.1 transcriptional repressor [Nocardiopsis sp. EMB25]